MKLKRQRSRKAVKAIMYAVLSGIFLAFDLSFGMKVYMRWGQAFQPCWIACRFSSWRQLGIYSLANVKANIQMLSLFLAVVGVVLISGEELQHNFEGLYGIIIGLISAGMLAASMLWLKRCTKKSQRLLFPLMFILSVSGAFVLIYSFANF